MCADDKATRLERGTAVTFDHYGERHTGRVIRDNGTPIVWVEDQSVGGLFRERWLHRTSLTAVPR